MPTYEYACRECGHRFDAVQSIHDDALTECPECGGPVRRVVAAVGVQFKGSGFYRTDNRPSGKTSGSATSGGSGGEGSATSAATSEKKSDTAGTSSGSTPKATNAKPSGGQSSGGKSSSGSGE